MFCLIVPLLNFNPRSHEGSDILPVPPPAAVSISIHAPTRGATWQTNEMQKSHKISIHAPTRGATVHIMPPSADFIISIHAPTRGATQAVLSLIDSLIISIHAPTRGATVMWLLLVQHQNIFQSTLPRGERLLVMLSAYMS